jgi:hypothetical protein
MKQGQIHERETINIHDLDDDVAHELTLVVPGVCKSWNLVQ